ncbi:MAG TPA: nickel-binding protein [Burkholderiaceae bacterium]|nr:nickel-binding protein [Burkholderiaceae bacterium]
MPVIIVERTFELPPSDADLLAIGQRQAKCLDIYGVTWKKSVISADRKRMVCEYAAADTESVRKVQREAQAPFERIWAGSIIE